jgi:hypothetical protein
VPLADISVVPDANTVTFERLARGAYTELGGISEQPVDGVGSGGRRDVYGEEPAVRRQALAGSAGETPRFAAHLSQRRAAQSNPEFLEY